MDPYNTHYQQQASSQSYDPSQLYNQSTQSYYTTYNNNNQQYPYDNNYAQYYIDPNYHPQQYQYPNEPTSIHPPGVPIQPDPTHLVALDQTHQQCGHYTQPQLNNPYVENFDSSQQWHGSYGGGYGAVSLQTHDVPKIAQTPFIGASNTRGGTTFTGASRGHFGPRSHGSASFRSSRGRGRVGGRGRAQSGIATPNCVSSKGASGSQQPTVSAPVCPPARIVWCELCRVDCNTADILEQHKNGKKHKKNLKFQEKLQKQNKMLVMESSEQVLNSGLKPQASYPTVKVESSEEKKLPEEILSTQTASATNEKKPMEQKEMDEAEQTEKLTPKSGNDNYVPQGQGLKRRMKGGQGGKWLKSHDGSRRPVDAPKPKEVIPLICEMCNAKCETPMVFDSHLKGKKHLANAKRFQEQQEAALQVLYPALQALIPTLQALGQLNVNNSSTPFAPQLHQQNIHGSQRSIEPGSSVFSQSHSSASSPFATAGPAPILETNEQQTSLLEGSTSGLNKSQDEPLQFRRVTEVPVDSSGVASQSTHTVDDQFSSVKHVTEAVDIPDSVIAPTGQAPLHN